MHHNDWIIKDAISNHIKAVRHERNYYKTWKYNMWQVTRRRANTFYSINFGVMLLLWLMGFEVGPISIVFQIVMGIVLLGGTHIYDELCINRSYRRAKKRHMTLLQDILRRAAMLREYP